MGKNRYFLLGRDKDNNKIKTISLSDTEVFNSGDTTRKVDNSLEKIDYFTLYFKNQDDLIIHLVNTGKLDNYNTELFIVCRNGDKISYLENLYSSSVMSRELKNVSLEKSKNMQSSFSNDEILDRFAFMMTNDRSFRRFIEYKYHKVYSKYIDYFSGCYTTDDAYKIKFRDTGWARNSYPLIRNIVEAMNRFEMLKRISGNLSNAAFEYEVDLNSRRNICLDEISIYTEKGYGEGQLNLFIEKDEEINSSEVANFIYQIDTDSFVLDNNKVVFNRKKFNCSDTEYRELNNLDVRVLRLIYLFLTTKRFIKNDHYDELTLYNVQSSILSNIQKLLDQHKNVLNNVYAFCQLYGRLSDKKIDSKIYKKVKGE